VCPRTVAPRCGANGEGDNCEAAIADLREALEDLVAEFGAPRAHIHSRRCLMQPVPSARGERFVQAFGKAGFKLVLPAKVRLGWVPARWSNR